MRLSAKEQAWAESMNQRLLGRGVIALYNKRDRRMRFYGACTDIRRLDFGKEAGKFGLIKDLWDEIAVPENAEALATYLYAMGESR